MCVTIEGGIDRFVIGGIGWSNGLGDDDGHNQTVNAQNTSHDNGDNVFDDSGGMVNAHVTDTQPGSPGSPGTPPTR